MTVPAGTSSLYSVVGSAATSSRRSISASASASVSPLRSGTLRNSGPFGDDDEQRRAFGEVLARRRRREDHLTRRAVLVGAVVVDGDLPVEVVDEGERLVLRAGRRRPEPRASACGTAPRRGSRARRARRAGTARRATAPSGDASAARRRPPARRPAGGSVATAPAPPSAGPSWRPWPPACPLALAALSRALASFLRARRLCVAAGLADLAGRFDAGAAPRLRRGATGGVGGSACARRGRRGRRTARSSAAAAAASTLDGAARSPRRGSSGRRHGRRRHGEVADRLRRAADLVGLVGRRAPASATAATSAGSGSAGGRAMPPGRIVRRPHRRRVLEEARSEDRDRRRPRQLVGGAHERPPELRGAEPLGGLRATGPLEHRRQRTEVGGHRHQLADPRRQRGDGGVAVERARVPVTASTRISANE